MISSQKKTEKRHIYLLILKLTGRSTANKDIFKDGLSWISCAIPTFILQIPQPPMVSLTCIPDKLNMRMMTNSE